jgi:hypothetical protein
MICYIIGGALIAAGVGVSFVKRSHRDLILAATVVGLLIGSGIGLIIGHLV